jgi:hypothetical protein
VRVGEDGGVVVQRVGGCADGGLQTRLDDRLEKGCATYTSGYHQVLIQEWLHGLTWEATRKAALVAK